MGRKAKNRKIPRTNQGLSFAVGFKGHGIDHWTHEATDMNRQLAKTRTNGKNEYVGPHVRRKKDGTEVTVEGYFRRPKYGPHIHQTKREVRESIDEEQKETPDGAVCFGVCQGPFCDGKEKHWLFQHGDELWCEGCIDEATMRAHDIDAMGEPLTDEEIADLDEEIVEEYDLGYDYSQG